MFSNYFTIQNLHSVIPSCQKLEIKFEKTILLAKEIQILLKYFTPGDSLAPQTRKHQPARRWAKGEEYCTNNASDFNKHQKCFLQKLDI